MYVVCCHVRSSTLCLCGRLFSRVDPAHKSRIVEYLQEQGHISAMVSACCGSGSQWCSLSCRHLYVYSKSFNITVLLLMFFETNVKRNIS